MKKMIVGMVLLGIGVAGYWILSPLWWTEVVDEALPEVPMVSVSVPSVSESPMSPVVPATTELYTGNFTGFDRLHQGSGTAKILQIGDTSYLRFESDFTVSNGPDLFVGFGKDGQFSAGSEISALKGNAGAQNYELSQGFDSTRFNEVYVWCRAFKVPFAKARLTQMQ